MKRKVLALLLTTALGVSCLAGCGSSESIPNETTASAGSSESSAQSKQESAPEAENANFNETGYPIVNEPVTLTAMIQVRDKDTMMDINEMPIIQQLEEETGIHVEWEPIKESDWSTKVSLMFATGEYPDMIFNCVTSPIDYEDYGVDQQIIIPLEEDMVAKYMPTYTSLISAESEDPTISLVASDGKKYSLGRVDQYGSATNVYTFINQTWMDNLGLTMPTSLDELTEVLRAFKTQDPNGNGEADEMPVEIGLNTSTHGIKTMLPLFGLPADGVRWIHVDEEGKVQLTPAQDGFRECMEWVHLLYEEELVDPEILSQDIPTIEMKLAEGKVGFFNAWRLKDKGWDEGAEKDCVLFVPWESAKFDRRLRMANPAVFLSSTNEHVAETLRYIDAMLEPEMMFSLRNGLQTDGPVDGSGWYYDEEGKLAGNKTTSETNVMSSLGSSSFYVNTNTFNKSHVAMTATKIATSEFSSTYEEKGILQTYSNELMNLVVFTPDQSIKYNLIETDLDSAVMEWMATFITEGVTDQNWAAFVKVLTDIGTDEYVQAYQDGIDEIK